MTLNLAVKITADAAQATASVREFRSEVGRVGEVGSTAAAGARTTATAIDEIGRRAGATVTSIAAVRAEVDKLSRQSLDRTLGVRTDFGTAARAADIADYGRQLDGLRAKFNPVWAAGQQYKRTLEEIAQAERVGAITTAEAIAAREKARVATGAQVTALRGQVGAVTGGTAKLADWQKQQIGFQLNDVATGLFSGQSPITIAAQQGPQIAQTLGGWEASFSRLRALVTPVTAGAAASAAAFVLAAKAATDYAGAVRATDTTALGLGRNLGLLGGDLRRMAELSAGAGQVSVDSARQMAIAYASTGKIAGSNIGDIITITRDFAATTQQDVPAATQVLAQAFADPVRGAETLASTYGLIDSATVRLVSRLAEQGRQTEAQGALLRALKPALLDASASVADYAKSWQQVSRWAADAYDWIGKALSLRPQSIDEQIAAVRQQIDALEKLKADRGNAPSAGWLDFGAAEIEQLGERKKKLEELEKARRDANDRLQRARQDDVGKTAVNAAGQSTAVQSLAGVGELEQRLRQLRAGLDAPNLTATERFRIATAIDETDRALRTYLPDQERQIQLARLELQIAEARDPVTRADLEAQRQRIQLAGQVSAGTEQMAEAEIALARARSLNQSLSDSKVRAADMREEAVVRGYLNDDVSAGTKTAADAGRQLQLELAVRPLVYAALKAEGDERRRLLAAIGEQTAAYKSLQSETQRAAAQQQIQSQRDGLEQTRLEIALIGQSEETRNRATAALQAEQRIRDIGIAKYGQEANELRRLAQAQAEATTTLARQQDAWRTVSGSIGGAIDTTTDAIARGKDLGQTFEGIAQDITASMLKLAVANPLKNAILGENNATIADAGGILGRLFGGGAAAAPAPIASALGTATITAGTVIVNGGVAGLSSGGSLFGSTTGSGGASAWDGTGVPKAGAAFRATTGAMDPIAVRSMFAQIATDQGLVGFVPSDGAKYGIKTGSAGEWANLFTGLSAHESGLRNSTVGDVGQFAGGSRGLLQLSYQDGLNWGYGRPFSAAELADPQFNGTAGVGIAKRLMMQSGSIEGGMGRYWGPISKEGWTPGNGRDAGLPWQSWTQDTTQVTGALDRFASSTGTATSGLNLFGSANDNAVKALTGFGDGLTDIGKSLVSGGGATAGGEGGGLFGWLFKGLGSLLGFADGGRISGPGTGTSDSILIAASNGEYMVKASAAAKHLPLLDAINNDRLPRFAEGGVVGVPMIDRRAYGTSPAQAVPAAAPGVVINNFSQARITERETSDGRGGRRREVLIEDVMAAAVRPGSKFGGALKNTFGLQERTITR